MNRGDVRQVGLAALFVAAAAAAHFLHVMPVLAFAAAAAAIALLARLVGGATEQLGGRVGSSAAGVVQSALGNLPELFMALASRLAERLANKLAQAHGVQKLSQASVIGRFETRAFRFAKRIRRGPKRTGEKLTSTGSI